MFIKVCGLSTPDDVAAAVAGGADALGFVFADSPRQVTPERARALCGSLGRPVIRVAVMLHPSAVEWARVRDVFEPDWLQTDAEDFATLGRVDCETLPVYRNAGLSAGRLPGRILFEGAQSGHGERADWPGAARAAARTRVILAGGLDCGNVVEAIESRAALGRGRLKRSGTLARRQGPSKDRGIHRPGAGCRKRTGSCPLVRVRHRRRPNTPGC